MNDPHVNSLRYKLVTDSAISYKNPPPLKDENAAYSLTLEDGVLIVEMKEHHATIGSAMDQVANHLRAWELQTAVDKGPGRLRFEFLGADVVDRTPPAPGTHVLHAGTGTFRVQVPNISMSGMVHLSCATYPDLPHRFVATPFVEHLWKRYAAYLDGKDVLTTVGYVIFSAIQSDAGSRQEMSAKYAIDLEVLKMMGKLTSDIGDTMSARKFDQFSQNRAHTPAEREWIETCAKILIRRAAEHAFDPGARLKPITMADLPSP